MRQWNIREQKKETVDALCAALGCTHFFARILVNRGLVSPADARAFLRADQTALLDPALFRDMDAVIMRITQALKAQEKITVYGDYDVDGITATSLMVEVLRELGGTVDYYIPSRFTEGYGVNIGAVRTIAARGTRLIITVDTGITATEEVAEARRLGVDVIISDHHECQQLPDTWIINPKYAESGYPFGDLAGVGVVYKIACALEKQFGRGDMAERYLPFAAIGTVADIMPLLGENRYIVRKGLEDLRNTDCVGLRALIDRCMGDKPVDTTAVGFVLAPRLNAVGRLDSAEVGVELLTTRDPVRAAEIVEQLCAENNRRQEIENQILTEAIGMIEQDPALGGRSAIVLWHEDWHAGVIGIVASRLKDRYGKPCILFSVNGEHAKGSGRSIRPFNLFETLERLQSFCSGFGGHAYAAGVLVHTGQLEAFRDAFCAEVDRFLEEHTFDHSLDMDCVLRGGDLTLEKIRSLDQLAPFGRGNETPMFCIRNALLLEAVPTVNRNHMRFTLQCGRVRVSAIYFNISPDQFCYLPGDTVDLVVEASINRYNGRQSLQLTVRDLCYGLDRRLAAEEELKRTEVPGREDAAAVYLFLKKRIQRGLSCYEFYALPDHIAAEGKRLSAGKVHLVLRILRELGVLDYEEDGAQLLSLAVHPEIRVNLQDSAILKEITGKAGEENEHRRAALHTV